REARRSRLEGAQLRIVVRGALGEDRDRAAAGQHAPRRLEGLAVLRRIRARVLTAVDGNGLEGAAQPADDRHPEQRSFGEKRHAARSKADEEAGIDEAVRVIEDEENGANGGNVLDTGDFDTTEEN